MLSKVQDLGRAAPAACTQDFRLQFCNLGRLRSVTACKSYARHTQLEQALLVVDICQRILNLPQSKEKHTGFAAVRSATSCNLSHESDLQSMLAVVCFQAKMSPGVLESIRLLAEQGARFFLPNSLRSTYHRHSCSEISL